VLWFFASLLLRTSIALAGFYLVARGHWERLLVCLLGFVIARLVVTRLTRAAEQPNRLEREDNHAP
jgi:F1F0 ATPase subunit 2